MKRSVLGHACWAAIAVVAFGLGSLRDKGEPEGRQSGPSAKSSRAQSPAGSRLAGAGDKGPRGPGGSRSSAGRLASLKAGSTGAAPLSEAALTTLVQDAVKTGSPLVRRAAFGRLLASLTADNATDIRRLLLENGVQSRSEQWRDFHYAWGTINGEAAVKSAIASKEYDLAYSMSGWASASPTEARRFLETLPEDVKTDRALLKRSLVSGMADSDTGLATNYVFELASQGDKSAGDLLGIVTSEVLRNEGLDQAVFWSEGLPDGPMKGAAMDRVAHSWVNRDPAAAAAWAEQFAGQDYAHRVIEEVGDEWAERDPVSAVAWLESLPKGEGQQTGLRSAFGEWARRDPAAAGERLVGMPRSEERDYAINGYAHSLAYRDPNAAIDWANSIADDGLRSSALTRAGQELFRRDAEAARTWVATSGLSAEAQQQVLNPPRRR